MNWLDVLPFFRTEAFTEIVSLLASQREQGTSILPAKENIFRALRETPFHQVKVVILGQDPYPTRTHANGLAFSVYNDVRPLPKSLINIFTELNTDISTKRENGDLTDWAQQGVLLLNTSLTVIEGKAGSHKGLWTPLTNEIVRTISAQRENVVFILWGRHAQEKIAMIDDDRHHIIISAHPSPLSAYSGFFGSKPFSRTNNFLTSKNITPINW